MTRFDLELAVKQIVAAVALKSRLIEATGDISLLSELQDDLSMDEVDIVDIIYRVENRLGLALPGINIQASCTVGDLVALITEQLSDKELRVVRARDDAFSVLHSNGIATGYSL